MSFTYKEANLKDNAVLISGDTRSVEYDDLSRETSTTIGTDFTREIAYLNVSGNKTTTLPASVSYSKGSVPIFNESYTYDNIGNIKTVASNGVTVTYSYDGLNQLTRASGSDGTVTKYFYNDGGNINYKVNADGSKTHYVYDAEWKDLLVGFGGQAITYDEIGNPINYLGNTMSWTGRQLDSITKADGTQISYTYDIDGIRTKKTVNGVTTEYFVNGSTILAQKTGNDIIWYIYDSDGQILGFTYNDTPYYYVKNLQGDVIKVIDTNGNVVASYTYDPWGKITSSTGTMAEINPIRYRGYYCDNETGLYYLNSRYYDPDTCRFINADGYVSTGQGILGFNMFAYCGNNPVVYMDLSGNRYCAATSVSNERFYERFISCDWQRIIALSKHNPTPIGRTDQGDVYLVKNEDEIKATFPGDVVVIDYREQMNSGVQIRNSVLVNDENIQRQVLMLLDQYERENPTSWHRNEDIKDILIEWNAHNDIFLFRTNVSCQHVDIDNNDRGTTYLGYWRRAIYEMLF